MYLPTRSEIIWQCDLTFDRKKVENNQKIVFFIINFNVLLNKLKLKGSQNVIVVTYKQYLGSKDIADGE